MSNVACPGCQLQVLPPPGVPRVACPRCGTAFDVPGSALPTAEVVGYRHPLSPPEETAPPPPSSMTWVNWLQLLFILAVFGGAAGYGYWEFYVREKPVPEGLPIDDIVFSGAPGSGQAVRSKGGNFRLDLPGTPWAPDEEIKKAVPSCVFAMKRSEPPGGLAVWAKDFRTHTPRDGVVLDEGIARLGKAFKGLSYEPRPDTEVAGKKAMHLSFRGTLKKEGVAGDCYLFAHLGIAYGLVAWGPDDSRELWKGFALLEHRDGWAEQQAKAQVLHGSRLAYSLQDPYAVWTRDADLQGYTGADLAVLARDPVAPRYLANAATVIVLIPPVHGTLDDVITHARQHLEKVQSKDHPDTKVNLLAGQEARVNIGNWKGLVSKFHVFSGDSRQRFVVQAVYQRPGAAVVVQCECPWQRRSLWERDFDEVVRTFRME